MTHKRRFVWYGSPLTLEWCHCLWLIDDWFVCVCGFQRVEGTSTGKDTERSMLDPPTRPACSLGVTWPLRAVCASLRAATTTSPTSTAASARKPQVTFKWPATENWQTAQQQPTSSFTRLTLFGRCNGLHLRRTYAKFCSFTLLNNSFQRLSVA